MCAVWLWLADMHTGLVCDLPVVLVSPYVAFKKRGWVRGGCQVLLERLLCSILQDNVSDLMTSMQSSQKNQKCEELFHILSTASSSRPWVSLKGWSKGCRAPFLGLSPGSPRQV